MQALTDLPVEFAKDTTSACMAEMLQGHGLQINSFLYIFVGTFVGGGLVVAGHIMAGPRGNAGAIGSMPTSLVNTQNDSSPPAQLLQLASGWQLEQSLEAAGFDPLLVHQDSIMDAKYAACTAPWLAQASRALAMTIVSATALVDLDAAVIDGSLGRSLITALISATREQIKHYNLEGLQPPAVMAGLAGSHATGYWRRPAAASHTIFPAERYFPETRFGVKSLRENLSRFRASQFLETPRWLPCHSRRHHQPQLGLSSRFTRHI